MSIASAVWAAHPDALLEVGLESGNFLRGNLVENPHDDYFVFQVIESINGQRDVLYIANSGASYIRVLGA